MCQMQRSRAEEEGKWDAVSKAIQKVQAFTTAFFVILLKLAPQTARQDAASDDSDNSDDSAGSSSS